MARVVIADDHPLFLEALAAALEAVGVSVVGSAGTGEQVLELVARYDPDAVLLDVEMPGMGGIECLKRLRATNPDIKVVIISAHDDETSIADGLEHGAICYAAKSVKPDDLSIIIRAITDDPVNVHYGARFPFGPAEQAWPANGKSTLHPDLAQLTKCEKEILLLAAAGRSNAGIAAVRGVTEQTVKFHLSNIYKKLHVTNRTQAAARARDLAARESYDSSAA